jgi:hypothetical protein
MKLMKSLSNLDVESVVVLKPAFATSGNPESEHIR